VSLTCTTYRYAAGSKGSAFLLILLFCLQAPLPAQDKPAPYMSNHSLQLPAFDKQGHRGCRGLMPENTLPALLHALELGVTTLEMDVVFTKDSVPILSHEPFFNHEITTLPDGLTISEEQEKSLNIFQMTFAETQQYDVGLKPHPRFPRQQKMAVHKPSLASVFDAVTGWCKEHKKPLPFFNIETKTTAFTDDRYHPAPAAFVEGLMKLIQAKEMQSQVMIQSFDIRTLQYLHKEYPAVAALLLVEDYDHRPLDSQLSSLGFTPAVYSPHYSLVTPALVADCHRLGMRLIPWTVNEKGKIEMLQKMGVDGIITDYPDLFNR